MMLVLIMVLALLGYGSCKNDDIFYVSPDEPDLKSCPSQPCYPLETYLNNSTRYFTTGTEFIFLCGYHHFQIPLYLADMEDISWRGIADNLSIVILYTESTAVKNVTHFKLNNLRFEFYGYDHGEFSAFAFTSSAVEISHVMFENWNVSIRAIHANSSTINISNCHFRGHTSDKGGAILATQLSNLVINTSSFITNKARDMGGAVYARTSVVHLIGNNIFFNNTGCSECFHNNSIEEALHGAGGAVAIDNSNITITGGVNFSHNQAKLGGGLSLTDYSSVYFNKTNITFSNNSALNRGGGMYSEYSSLTGHKENLTFIANTAQGSILSMGDCGTLCIFNVKDSPINNTLSMMTLYSNSGKLGGALFAEKTDGFTLGSIHAHNNSDGAVGFSYSTVNITGHSVFLNNKGRGAININSVNYVSFFGKNEFRNNHGDNGAIGIFNRSVICFEGTTSIVDNVGYSGGGAITLVESTVTFMGNAVISGNKGIKAGGGITAVRSNMSLFGNALFSNNTGENGGAMSITSDQICTLNIRGIVSFKNNKAKEHGGALLVSNINIKLSDSLVSLLYNSAILGGALYFALKSALTIGTNTSLVTEGNRATHYGGVIYHKDSVVDSQCTNVAEAMKDNKFLLDIPPAFFQVTDIHVCPTINSSNDYAGIDGSFLYGGLLDRSKMNIDTSYLPYNYFVEHCSPSISIDNSDDQNSISSDPYSLKFCYGSDHGHDNNIQNVSVYRGQTFWLNFVAVGQGNHSAKSSTIVATTNRSAVLKINQNSQPINDTCAAVKFNLFSSLYGSDGEALERLTLYPDGLCQAVSEASTVINVHLLPCPHAFNQSGNKCDCEDRLKEYVNCTIENKVSILQRAGIKVWLNASYNRSSFYEGLILYPACPSQYCAKGPTDMYLDSPEKQCAPNRTGILCGQCATNYSLLLGNSQCAICSNKYLYLLIVFAVAGLALILFLSFTGMTVNTGTINAFIFYANLVQVNRDFLFFSGHTNPLTIFVAWLSLDLGFNVCFYDGMDSYAQIWLQFSFPLYVCVLMASLIIASRYSDIAYKIVGPNPFAILGTVLLMSYSKLLKVIIDVLFFVNLEYPNGKYLKVWMKDGNFVYMSSKHWVLFLFASIVLVFLFIPYTALLLLGQGLYQFQNRKYLQLMNKIKPFLSCYVAPYKHRTRYWTGILMVVRCILYTVFSFNPLGGTCYSLLAIVVVLSAVGALSWLNKGVYKHFYIDVIEVSTYLDLIMLSAAAATLPETSKDIVTSLLVAMVVVMFVAVLCHHIYALYLEKSVIHKNIVSMIARLRSSEARRPLLDADESNKKKDVSQTVVCVTP